MSAKRDERKTLDPSLLLCMGPLPHHFRPNLAPLRPNVSRDGDLPKMATSNCRPCKQRKSLHRAVRAAANFFYLFSSIWPGPGSKGRRTNYARVQRGFLASGRRVRRNTQRRRVPWPQDVGFDETLSLYTRLPTLPGGCLAQAGDDRAAGSRFSSKGAKTRTHPLKEASFAGMPALFVGGGAVH